MRIYNNVFHLEQASEERGDPIEMESTFTVQSKLATTDTTSLPTM